VLHHLDIRRNNYNRSGLYRLNNLRHCRQVVLEIHIFQARNLQAHDGDSEHRHAQLLNRMRSKDVDSKRSSNQTIAYSLEDPLYHTVEVKDKQRFWKRILIVDDEADVTLTFKAGIEMSNNDVSKRIEVYTSTNPVIALSEFEPNFYDLLLLDINMPHMNGFELSEEILAIDISLLREIYPSLSLGCFIRKPITIDYLVKRIMSELD
jgi:CheY-like chemotaxis protein